MPSKLTFHIMGYDSKVFDLLEQMQPSLVKILDFPSETNIDEIRRRCPLTLIVYRQYTNLTIDDPADAFVAELDNTYDKLRGRGIIWEGINEPIIDNQQAAQTTNVWYIRFADLMHARGEKVAAFSFSTGSPRLDCVPLLAPAASVCDYIALHEYYNPISAANDLARYRTFRSKLSAEAQKPILITECGVDDGQNNGWQRFYSLDQYISILAGYDKQLLQDSYVVGATIFQYGAGGPWRSFDITSIGRKIADYVANAGGGPSGGGGESPILLEHAVIMEARNHPLMPINTDASLYKFAQVNNLGYPQTDEYEFTYNGETFVGQVFNLGIVYVKKGEWSNVKWVQKP